VIEPQSCPAQDELEEVTPIAEFNGTILYRCPPVLQVSPWAAKAFKIGEVVMRGSAQFAIAAKISDGAHVEVAGERARFTLDPMLKGTVALAPITRGSLSGYRYMKVHIERVD
ncbi:MAG: ferredoxin, partial [Campylobacterales bacterium]